MTMRFRCDKKDQATRHKKSEEWFSPDDLANLQSELQALVLTENQATATENDRWLLVDKTLAGDSLGPEFKDSVADMVRDFIQAVTPAVDHIMTRKQGESG